MFVEKSFLSLYMMKASFLTIFIDENIWGIKKYEFTPIFAVCNGRKAVFPLRTAGSMRIFIRREENGLAVRLIAPREISVEPDQNIKGRFIREICEK